MIRTSTTLISHTRRTACPARLSFLGLAFGLACTSDGGGAPDLTSLPIDGPSV